MPPVRRGPKPQKPLLPTGSGRKRRRRVCAVLLLAGLAGATGVAAAISPAVRHQLSLSFTRQPDNFAELYFPSPSTLPTSFIPGRPLAVTFGLTNDSEGTRAFPYVVIAGADDGRNTAVGSGTLRVRANHGALATLHLSLAPDTTSLSISLSGQPVVIRLLLHRGAAHGS